MFSIPADVFQIARAAVKLNGRMMRRASRLSVLIMNRTALRQGLTVAARV